MAVPREYLEACNYPGRLDEAAVNAALTEYCKALGITRTVRRLGPDWEKDEDLKTGLMMAARAARDALAEI